MSKPTPAIDYSLGFDASAAAALQLTIATCVALLVLMIYQKWKHGEDSDDFFGLATFIMSLVFFLLPAALLTAIYPLMNLWLLIQARSFDLPAWAADELQNGALGLRATSIVLTVALTAEIRDFFGISFWTWNNPPENKHDGFKRLAANVFDYNVVVLCQYAVYFFAATLLWINLANDKSSIAGACLSWAFFFIVDDWVIICAYVRRLRGHIVRSHSYRIHGFNVLLLSFILVLIREGGLGQTDPLFARFLPICFFGAFIFRYLFTFAR